MNDPRETLDMIFVSLLLFIIIVAPDFLTIPEIVTFSSATLGWVLIMYSENQVKQSSTGKILSGGSSSSGSKTIKKVRTTDSGLKPFEEQARYKKIKTWHPERNAYQWVWKDNKTGKFVKKP